MYTNLRTHWTSTRVVSSPLKLSAKCLSSRHWQRRGTELQGRVSHGRRSWPMSPAWSIQSVTGRGHGAPASARNNCVFEAARIRQSYLRVGPPTEAVDVGIYARGHIHTLAPCAATYTKKGKREHIHAYPHVHARTHAHAYMYTNAHMHIHPLRHIHTRIRACVCLSKYLDTHIFV